MFRPAVLVLALILSASTLWSAFADGSIDITSALIRFLIAIPVAWAMLQVLTLAAADRSDRARASRQVAEQATDGDSVA